MNFFQTIFHMPTNNAARNDNPSNILANMCIKPHVCMAITITLKHARQHSNAACDNIDQ